MEKMNGPTMEKMFSPEQPTIIPLLREFRSQSLGFENL